MAYANPGCEAFIVSPTYDMVRDNTVPAILKFWPDGVCKDVGPLYTRAGGFKIELYNGSVISFKSADDPEHLRGPNLGWAWLDEAGQMKPYAWHIIMGRIRVPCAMPGIIITTTPKGFNWLYDTFYLNPPTDDYQLIQWDARENQCHLAEGYYDRLEAGYPKLLADQEVRGAFVNINAMAYLDGQSVIDCQADGYPKMPTSTDYPLYIGIDIGRRHDLTVIVGLWRRGDTYCTGILKTMAGAPYVNQRAAIASLLPRATRCCIDATGIGNQLAEELADEWGSMVEPVTFTAPRKDDMGSRLRSLFEKRLLRIPKTKELMNDLLSVETLVGPTGNVRLNASRNEDGHADRFWAYALAATAASGIDSDEPIVFL